MGEADFVIYNLLLLWILSPSSSITIQICVLFGFIIMVQIGIVLTAQLRSLWEEQAMPALPFPVILVSTYAILVDYIVQNLDVDEISVITLNKIE